MHWWYHFKCQGLLPGQQFPLISLFMRQCPISLPRLSYASPGKQELERGKPGISLLTESLVGCVHLHSFVSLESILLNPTLMLPGVGNCNPLQHSCLENSTDREAWQAMVHRVAKSQTQFSDWAHKECARVRVHTHTHTHNLMPEAKCNVYSLQVWINLPQRSLHPRMDRETPTTKDAIKGP